MLSLAECTCESINMNPLEYGYIEDDNMIIIPVIVIKEVVPEDFPMPCNCLKCARSNICICRIKNIECCKFCKCRATNIKKILLGVSKYRMTNSWCEQRSRRQFIEIYRNHAMYVYKKMITIFIAYL